jgi:predicted nuclease of restriction endonuclease-like (RecB) superfamily
MKKQAIKKSPTLAKAKPESLSSLLTEVRQLIQSARRSVSTVVDTFQVMTNFEIGRRIVEHEQKGAKRAAYGAELLKELSSRLTEEFGRGFSRSNLEYMRKFFLEWESRVQISQQPIGKLPDSEISQQATGKLESLQIGQSLTDQLAILQQPAEKLAANQIFQSPSGKSRGPFTLSWTHYVLLLTIKDPDERSFYEIEATNAGWSVPELKRQKASCLYERLALSRDKAGIRKLAKEGQIITRPEDLLKEPLVLEFLGLDAQASYSESDLEQAIINRLEHFLLELGKGFLFEARQKRFTFDEDHYFVDLVFYNRLLRC